MGNYVDYFGVVMSSEDFIGRIILLKPADALAKITDVVESIVSDVLAVGQVNIVGLNGSMFVVCSAINIVSFAAFCTNNSFYA